MTTTAPPPINYASPITSTCPLCQKRPVGKKQIYGYPVCRKCYYAFANRRQLAYLIDSLIVMIPNILIGIGVTRYIRGLQIPAIEGRLAATLAAIPMTCLFLMKDGFSGYSPGKKAMGVQAIDQKTGQPISFGQSFARNSPLLIGLIPYAGPVIYLVVILIISSQLGRGYRWGDRLAKTRVIWKKYEAMPMFSHDALVCEGCGYDLRGNTLGVCPECGQAISPLNAERLNAERVGAKRVGAERQTTTAG